MGLKYNKDSYVKRNDPNNYNTSQIDNQSIINPIIMDSPNPNSLESLDLTDQLTGLTDQISAIATEDFIANNISYNFRSNLGAGNNNIDLTISLNNKTILKLGFKHLSAVSSNEYNSGSLILENIEIKKGDILAVDLVASNAGGTIYTDLTLSGIKVFP